MVFDWFFPQRCLGCQKEGSYLCAACEKKLEPLTGDRIFTPYSRLDGLSVVFDYNFLVRRLIHKLKYRRIFGIADLLAKRAADWIKNQDIYQEIKQRQSVIVPVPLYWLRFNWRGFNQSEKLGEVLAADLGLSLEKWLIRKRFTWSQVGLSKPQREKNISQAFAVKKGVDLTGESTLLIDDVWTTGATINQCATVLKKAGAKWVWALVLAR